MQTQFKNFREFYAHYISAHQNIVCRRLHFAGTSLVIAALIYARDMEAWWEVVGPAAALGYAMAWIGHFRYEKNKPATFGNPLWSFFAGQKMYLQMITGRMSLVAVNRDSASVMKLRQPA